MLIAIIGENCTGKSTIAKKIAEEIPCEIYTGRDYLRLAKNESNAKTVFQKKLEDAVTGENLIYIISEKEHLPMLPEGTYKILVTAELEQIKSRFSVRMHGKLPVPVEAMLTKNHGCFDAVSCHMHVISEITNPEEVVDKIKAEMIEHGNSAYN